MGLDVRGVIDGGLGRAATRSAAVLVIATFAFGVTFIGALGTILVQAMPAVFAGEDGLAFTLPVSASVAAAVAAVSMLFGHLLFVVATRALTRPHAELSTLPPSLVTRRMGRATLSAIGASTLALIATTIGYLLLVVPGIFLNVSFLFVFFAVGVEDRRAVDALGRSWTLVSGERWHLFGLLLVLAVAHGVVAFVVTSMFTLVDPVVGDLANLFVDSVAIVAADCIFAEAYLRLREGDDGEREAAAPDPTVPPA